MKDVLQTNNYLKLTQADIWAVPPNTLKIAQDWFSSVYAANVAALAQTTYTKLTQSIDEVAKLSDDLNTLLVNFHKILAGMSPGETKEIPINANVFKHVVGYDTTSILLSKISDSLYDMQISTSGKIISKDLKSAGAPAVISAVDDFISAILDKMDHEVSDQNIAEIKLLLNMANKSNTDNVSLQGRDSIGKTIEIDLSGWPYLEKVKNNHIKLLSDIIESNNKGIDQIIEHESELKEFGDQIGPFFLKSGRNTIYAIDVQVNTKNGLNVQTSSGESKHNVVLKNKSRLKELLILHFVRPIEGLLRAARVGNFDNYLTLLFPKLSKINLVYQNRPPKMDNEKVAVSGSWSQHNFTLLVRPTFVNPISEAKLVNSSATAAFNYAMRTMQDTIRHELQHFAQNIATLLTTGKSAYEYGLPSKNTAPFELGEYAPTGEAQDQNKTLGPQDTVEKYQAEEKEFESKMLKHELRDVEYQTRLADEISVFKQISNSLPKGLLPRAIRIWTGALSEDLFPFASGKYWNDYKQKHGVDDNFVLTFLKDNKVYLPNIENMTKNKLAGNNVFPTKRNEYIQEVRLLRSINRKIGPANFFKVLKELASKKGDSRHSRWAQAVSSFVKGVS